MLCPVRFLGRHILTRVGLFLLAPAVLLTPGPTGGIVTAQPPSDPGAVQITAAHRADIVDSLARALTDIYVFPDVADRIVKLMRKNLRSRVYDSLTTLGAFMQRVDEDLRSVNNDGHLRAGPTEPRTADEEDPEAAAARRAARLERLRRSNYGFRRLEILPGNIGYVDLREFVDARYGGETAVAAMHFLAGADALIIDLRNNSGGEPSMVQLLMTYLLPRFTHLNSFYIRREDTVTQFWTNTWVPGPRLTDVPVYVLTSAETFSAAEEFSYNLRHLERATLVGETTAGGAHPTAGFWFRIDEGVYIDARIPFGRAINPITGTNWEGTGVEPHIQVPADAALTAARLDFVKRRLEQVEDEAQRQRFTWLEAGLKAELEPAALAVSDAEAFVGTYGPRTISLANGSLFYRREQRPRYRLIPMGDDLFGLDGLDHFRIRFERDADGRVVKLIGLYDDGDTDSHRRSPSGS